ncbi:hypothetical protein UFOVP134_24 [uncultured Caudovirales phage]|uniref:Uncharacterized protein n=1 Tax=uncultured Caudovirales phage TaxID=2100421 RepID=A0A6J5LG70_9CAUD|nr:hypothetical protein UFOVP134_24 [uncultured Caudovirales phage]
MTDHTPEEDEPVFDRATTPTDIGHYFDSTGFRHPLFYSTARDRTPPRSTSTATICGDPVRPRCAKPDWQID